MDIEHTSNNKEDIIKDYVNNKNNIENHINNYLNDNNLDINYKLNIGRNKFNKKVYKGVTYDNSNDIEYKSYIKEILDKYNI